MIVKRYFQGTVDTSVQENVVIREVELTEHATYEDCLKHVFQYKLAGNCDGYEIIDLPGTADYHKLRNDTGAWQELQDCIIERWYDKESMVQHRKSKPGFNARSFMK